MAIQKAETIVLKTKDFRETSLIAVLFTREFGKIKGLAKGIRGDFGKFGSHLLPFSHNHIVFYPRKNGLNLISQADLNEGFYVLRDNLKKAALANYLLELIDIIMPWEDRNETIFDLLFCSLKLIAQDIDLEKLKSIFEIRLLALSGFKPELHYCVLCNEKIIDEARFSNCFGGLLCIKCRFKDPTAVSVLKGTVATIYYLENSSWRDCLRLNIKGIIKRQLYGILSNFLEFHLGKSPKSLNLWQAQKAPDESGYRGCNLRLAGRKK